MGRRHQSSHLALNRVLVLGLIMSCSGPPVVEDYHLGGSQCQGWTLISQGATGPVGGFGNRPVRQVLRYS